MKQILLATRPLVPPWDEASKNFAYFLAKSINAHHVSILTTPAWLPDLPANITQIPCYTKNELDFSEKMRLLSTLRNLRGKFDITHYLFTPTRKNTSLINFFSRPTHGKTLQTIATLREDLYGPKQWKQLLFAHHIVVYSDYSKKLLQNIGFHNVSRIYPGVDLSFYQPAEKNTQTLEYFDVTSEDFIVTYNGEYARLGATDMLTDWLIKYFTNHPDSNMKFIFACRVKKHEDDQLKKMEITKRFKEAGVIQHIRFTDTYADMPKLYNLADIIVFPVNDMRGKFDVPLVIIEAYACGKPVILSDLPLFKEFANPDICVTIPRGDMKALSLAITKLQAHPEERIRLGQSARTFVETHFDLQNTVKEYERLYDSL
ncbi:MAG: glycosyltransferase family 4 protein [Candidatus Moranbacteria bacterium]|jgi:glycosyltransferase involved in cell wall biosynthesis|nr:glycosyltransferase family 4 protein [Candidatus Moranbacteria bacterium]MBP9801516.1 glycosyltransferase family 4 protein [Candidatus Moranbacteria bacterium]